MDHSRERQNAGTSEREDLVIREALSLLDCRMRRGVVLGDSETARAYAMLMLHDLEQEVFGAFWLDTQHRLLPDGFEILFRGTLDQVAVYPREVVKAALSRNAASVILAHNHPSGIAMPSVEDRSLTQRLQRALGLVGVRMLDHIIVGTHAVSLAELGNCGNRT